MKNKFPKLAAVCSAVILLTAAAFLFFAKENEKRISAQNLEYIQDSTVQMARRVDHVLMEGYDTVQMLAAFLSRSLDSPEVDVEFLRKFTEDSAFDFLEFADKDGMNHNVTGNVSDARDRQYYLDGMKGNVGLDVIFDSRATHETLLMFYAPVTYQEEEVGVLVGVYQAAKKMEELLTASYFGEMAKVYLSMPEGRVVASNLPLDTKEYLNITDVAGVGISLSGNLFEKLQPEESLTFSMDGKHVGGCVTKLCDSGWYLTQIFPEAANTAMVQEANAAGMLLEIFLITVFGSILLVVCLLYVLSRKQRRNIEEVAEERGKYKNAVLADAMIIFEANLTQNVIQEGAWKKKNGQPISTEEALGISLPCSYDTYIEAWAQKYVKEDSRKLFLENTGREYLCQAFAEGKSEITFDYYSLSLDGEEIYARRSIYLVEDGRTGEVIAYSNVKDITEQVSKERKMHQYEQMLITTANGIYKGVRQIDLDDFKMTYLSFENDILSPGKREIGVTGFASRRSMCIRRILKS